MSLVVWDAVEAAARRHGAIWHRRTPWHIGSSEPGQPVHCETDVGGKGAVDVTLHLKRDDTEGHGWSRRRYSAGIGTDGSPSRSMLAAIDEAMRRASGVQRRNAAIRSAGDSIDFPAPWAFVAHGTVAAALRLAGYDPACLSRSGSNRPKYRPTAAEYTLAFPLKEKLGFGLDPETFMESRALVRAKALGLVRPKTAKSFDRIVDVDDVTGPTSVLLWGVRMPETTMLALRGRPIAEVVDHELFDGMAETKVSWIGPDAGGTVLRYADVRTTLEPVPSGIDSSWIEDV